MKRVALIGASGFIGSHVRAALERRAVMVMCIPAPRLQTPARDPGRMIAEIESRRVLPEMRLLGESLAGCDAVVNAAGVATALGDGDALFGANALLPGMLAALAPSEARVVQISTAAVQGRRSVLDESEEMDPFSPYSFSKSLGETVVLALRPDAVCYRPTSVHGPGRNVTRSLIRVLKSPLASVAGEGDHASPQILVDNVGDAVAMLATTEESPPRVVLHPSEGMTTGSLVRVLGGREPLHVPLGFARAAVAAAYRAGQWVSAGAGVARRLEMLWFGQSQGRSWLNGRWVPIRGFDSWKEL